MIGRITRNTYCITPPGSADWIDMWGHYPKTLKASKAIIDNMETTRNEKKGD